MPGRRAVDRAPLPASNPSALTSHASTTRRPTPPLVLGDHAQQLRGWPGGRAPTTAASTPACARPHRRGGTSVPSRSSTSHNRPFVTRERVRPRPQLPPGLSGLPTCARVSGSDDSSPQKHNRESRDQRACRTITRGNRRAASGRNPRGSEAPMRQGAFQHALARWPFRPRQIAEWRGAEGRRR